MDEARLSNCDGESGDEVASELAVAAFHHTGLARVEDRQVDDAAGSFSCVLYPDLDFDRDFQVCCHVYAHGHPIGEG